MFSYVWISDPHYIYWNHLKGGHVEDLKGQTMIQKDTNNLDSF
jgi:hypothetical protein